MLSSFAEFQVMVNRQMTKGPSDGSKPIELPPSGADLDVMAGGRM